MKYMSLFLVTFITMGAAITSASHPHEAIRHEVTAVKSIESQLDSCRQTLQGLVQENPKVLKQFDTFAKTLRKAYLAGEGLIHKDMHRIIEGVIFSAEKHRFQTRKDPEMTPYIIHPMGVANNLMTIGNVRDADIIIGALLHDTVEDTETSFEEIEQHFGLRVACFIREVTDDKSLPKQERKQLQIEHAPDKSAGAAQIKLADKLYNLKDLLQNPPSDWEKARIDAYFQWAQAVVDQLPWVNAPLKQAVDNIIHTYWKKKAE